MRKGRIIPVYDGRPCINCGSTLRYTNNRNCVACTRKRAKAGRDARRAAKAAKVAKDVVMVVLPSRGGEPVPIDEMTHAEAIEAVKVLAAEVQTARDFAERWRRMRLLMDAYGPHVPLAFPVRG